MNYTFEFNGMIYEIPRFTKSVKNKMDRINENNTSNLPEDKKFKDMYLFIKEEVGVEAAREIFGTDNIEEMDLNDITVCYIKIANAYEKPVGEAKKSVQDRLSDVISDEDRELVLSILKNADTLGRLDKNIGARKTTEFGAPLGRL